MKNIENILIKNIKDQYSYLYDKYEYSKKISSEMSGLDRLAPAFGMSFDKIIPLFENDLIGLVNKNKIKYVDDQCKLYRSHCIMPDHVYDFKAEIMDYKMVDGKLISDIIPNKNAGEFRESLDKIFSYFLESYKPTGAKTIYIYKKNNWDGKTKLVIEGLLKL